MSRSIRAEQQIEVSPYSHHLEEFLTFLKKERGFADATLVNRQRSLKPFLAWLNAQDIPLSAVSPVVITKYFTSAVAGKWKRTSVSFHVQSLRSFFRYASSRGWCAAGIAESIDAPRLYTYENLPQGPSWEEVGKLLASVDGTSPVQIRSRCAILLCAVYGFRVGEVCWMRLEDIDWAEEKISVRRSKTEENPNLSPDHRSWECTSPLSEGGKTAVCAARSLRDAQAAIPASLRWRSFHDDSEAAEEVGPEAQAIWLARSASCLCHASSGPGSDTEGGGRSPGTHVRSGYSNLCQGRSGGLREVAALDVRPLVACIEQCEQVAAPFYRMGEIQALRAVGNLGLGGVA